MKISKILFFIQLLFICSFPIRANESEERDTVSRPVTGVYGFGIGNRDLLATYLSPLHYHGTVYSIDGYWRKALPFNPEHSVMSFRGDVELSNLINPAKTYRMWGINAGFAWGMAWRTVLPSKVEFTAGGNVSLDGGAYYLMKNSNNPVQIMGRGAIGLTGSVAYPFKIGKLGMVIADNIELPSIGLFFSPQYEESFYEIYLGNHEGLIHAGWWGNNFRLNNLLSLTFNFGRTAAMIGYRFNVDTQWANNLNTRILTHSFVIGIIPGGLR